MKKILSLLSINELLFNEILNVITVNHYHKERKLSYCFEYMLILIMYMKNNFNSWKLLGTTFFCHNNYKSVYNQFLRWSNKGIFKKAFEVNISNNEKLINDTNSNVIIDATCISNKYGSENVSYNPEYKKKKVTKVSILCSENNMIVGVSFFKMHDKKIIFNEEEKIIQTFEHDSKTIQDTINKVDKSIKINDIIGDGGYKTKDKISINKKIIKVITPDRKNQKNDLNNEADNKSLKIRHKVENVIGSVKMNNERVFLRKDRKLSTFSSWVFVGCLEHNINIIKKNKDIKKPKIILIEKINKKVKNNKINENK